MKVSDADIAFQIMRTLLTFKKPIYLQKYVEKPNRDIRVMVIDGEVFGCMIRVAPPLVNGKPTWLREPLVSPVLTLIRQ